MQPSFLLNPEGFFSNPVSFFSNPKGFFSNPGNSGAQQVPNASIWKYHEPSGSIWGTMGFFSNPGSSGAGLGFKSNPNGFISNPSWGSKKNRSRSPGVRKKTLGLMWDVRKDAQGSIWQQLDSVRCGVRLDSVTKESVTLESVTHNQLQDSKRISDTMRISHKNSVTSK